MARRDLEPFSIDGVSFGKMPLTARIMLGIMGLVGALNSYGSWFLFALSLFVLLYAIRRRDVRGARWP